MTAPRRLPSGSTLTACVRRLARLQTTREMNPPASADKREKAIDRLILAARRVLLLGCAVGLLLLAVAPTQASQGWVFWFQGQPSDAFGTKEECRQHMRRGLQSTACILGGRCACFARRREPIPGAKREGDRMRNPRGNHDAPGTGEMRRVGAGNLMRWLAAFALLPYTVLTVLAVTLISLLWGAFYTVRWVVRGFSLGADGC